MKLVFSTFATQWIGLYLDLPQSTIKSFTTVLLLLKQHHLKNCCINQNLTVKFDTFKETRIFEETQKKFVHIFEGQSYCMYSGNIGATGLPGRTGSTGIQGLIGPVGLTGPQGDTGATGPIGQTGKTGSTGPYGPPGSQGFPGQPGSVGGTGWTGC